MPLADVEFAPRRSRRGLCSLTVDYGDGGRCAKFDKQIAIAHAVLAHSSGTRYTAAEVCFLMLSGGISVASCRPVSARRRLLQVMSPSRRRGVEVCPFLYVMGPQSMIQNEQIWCGKLLPRPMVTTRF